MIEARPGYNVLVVRERGQDRGRIVTERFIWRAPLRSLGNILVDCDGFSMPMNCKIEIKNEVYENATSVR